MAGQWTYVLLLAVCIALCIYTSPSDGMMVGSYRDELPIRTDSDSAEVIEHVKTVAEKIRRALECSSLGRQPKGTVLVPLKYRKQLVNGLNYLIKLRVGPNIVHVKLYKPFKGLPTFRGVVVEGVTENSTLEPSANYADCSS